MARIRSERLKLRRKATLSAFRPKDGVTFSLSVTVFCSLFSLSCDSEFNSSTSMNVVIGSVGLRSWVPSHFSQIDLHQKTP